MTAIVPSAPVLFDDLLTALEWTSDLSGDDPLAFVARATGRVYMTSVDHPCDELPDDVYDESRYTMVPSRHDLNLGKRLAVRFAQTHLPQRLEDVYECFSRRGAYARFRDVLSAEHALDAWYAFENAAVESALREWADAHALVIAVEPARSR
jgi:hypothetical protein